MISNRIGNATIWLIRWMMRMFNCSINGHDYRQFLDFHQVCMKCWKGGKEFEQEVEALKK